MFWEKHADTPLNQRQRLILNKMLDGFAGKLTSTQRGNLAKCSQDTAHRGILELIHQDVLVKDAAGGRSTSYSLREA